MSEKIPVQIMDELKVYKLVYQRRGKPAIECQMLMSDEDKDVFVEIFESACWPSSAYLSVENK